MGDVVEKIPTFASNMINFFSTYGNSKESKELYKNVEVFLRDNFNISPLLVFSFPQNHDGTINSFRCLWNKKAFDDCYDKYHIKKIMNDVNKMGPGKDKWVSEGLSVGYYHAFYFGPIEDQMQVGIFQTEEMLDDKYRIFECLINFVGNENRKINEWRDIEKQRSLIYVDDVSGLYNQRKLYLDVEKAVVQYRKYGRKFSVLFIDIDYFKKINESHGHLTGSKLLFEVAGILKRTLRDDDLIYRYGGDEYVVIIENVHGAGARDIAERILEDIKGVNFTSNKGNLYNITVSIGVALYPDDISNSSEILEMADKMMFNAKTSGRGRVCMMRDLYGKK